MPLTAGPEARPGPAARFERQRRARARCRVTPATTAGDMVLCWTRDEVHPVRNYSANPKTAAPLLCGRRRRRHRQWRAAVPHRKHGGDETGPRLIYGDESRGERVQDGAKTHPGDDGGDGEVRGGSTAPESKTKTGGGGCGKTMMATRRGHPRKRSSAWT